MTKKILAIIVAVILLQNGIFHSLVYAESINTEPHREAVKTARTELKPGSLIMHRGNCLSVRIYTRSAYTHVAIVMPVQKGEGWVVYDSARKHGVRKSNLSDYLEESSPDKITFLHPCQNLNKRQCEQLRENLEKELGRPYAVKHHLTGKKSKGVHCSEYVTEALIAIDLLRARQPSRVSPASLLEGILQYNVYKAGTILKVATPDVASSENTGWCSRLWSDTKTCTNNCYRKVGRLVFSEE